MNYLLTWRMQSHMRAVGNVIVDTLIPVYRKGFHNNNPNRFLWILVSFCYICFLQIIQTNKQLLENQLKRSIHFDQWSCCSNIYLLQSINLFFFLNKYEYYLNIVKIDSHSSCYLISYFSMASDCCKYNSDMRYPWEIMVLLITFKIFSQDHKTRKV